MRIALLPSAYFPMVGGVEGLTRHLARHLRDGGDDVEVWTPRQHGLPPEAEVDGIPVRRVDMPLPRAQAGAVARFPAAAGRSLATLLREFRRFRPDVLHVQCFSGNGAYATALSWLGRVPLVVTLQGETFMDDDAVYRHSVALRMALRVGLRRATAVTGCSQFVLDDARRFGLAPGRGQVIFNGVDVAEPQDGEGALAAPFRRYVACLGRLVHNKGFDLVLSAFPDVARRFPGVGLVIGGGGPCRPALEAQARRLGLQDRVWFAGTLDPRQVRSMLHQAEVFVMPSRVEPFGIVVLEAWRGRCPVIVTSSGGPPEFVRPGIDGLIADPTDTAMVAQAICGLLADPDLRLRLAREGGDRVSEFAWPVIASRYREIYEQEIAAGGRWSRGSSSPDRYPLPRRASTLPGPAGPGMSPMVP